jgi:membrane protease YdiL (CAAX protease family)
VNTRNFSIGALGQAGTGFGRISSFMTDPTEMVLTGLLAAALGLFVISATVRAVLRRAVKVDPAPAGDEDDETPRWTGAPPPEIPSGLVPVWFYRAWDLFGAAFVFAVFSGLALASLGSPEHESRELSPKLIALNIGFQFLIAGIVAAFVLSRVGLASWLGLRWSRWPWLLLIAPASVLFMWVVFGSLQMSGYVKWMESLGVETVQDTVQLLQTSEDPLVLGLMACAAVIAAPLCEEIVFRGYLYPVLKKFTGIRLAAICSALVFAAAHGNLTALLPLFLFGGLLVFVYEKTGSLWAPIAVHFCFNGATVAIQIAARYLELPIQAPQ